MSLTKSNIKAHEQRFGKDDIRSKIEESRNSIRGGAAADLMKGNISIRSGSNLEVISKVVMGKS